MSVYTEYHRATTSKSASPNAYLIGLTPQLSVGRSSSWSHNCVHNSRVTDIIHYELYQGRLY